MFNKKLSTILSTFTKVQKDLECYVNTQHDVVEKQEIELEDSKELLAKGESVLKKVNDLLS